MTSCPGELVLVGALSAVATSMLWRIGRRRRLERLLRRASLHPDPDRRLAALFIAALDGLGRHLDLVLAYTRNETADVVRTSLVDLVMEEEWKDERDERVAAVRTWARGVVAEQRHALLACRAPRASRREGRGVGSPLDGVDGKDGRRSPPVPTRRRSAARQWARSGGLPEIDALEVLDAVERRDGRTRRSSGSRRATSKVGSAASPAAFVPVFELLPDERGAVDRPGASTRSPAPRAIRLPDRRGDISAAV